MKARPGAGRDFPQHVPYLFAGITPMMPCMTTTSASRHLKFILEFDRTCISGHRPGPSRFRLVDYKPTGRPRVAKELLQCIEKEYMTADEYDLLLMDPSFFFRNFYLPRVYGAMQGFTMLPPFTGILEMYGVAFNFIPFGLPPVQETFQKLFEAGAEALKWAGAMGGCDAELKSLGYPNILAGYSKAPFDVLGDTLRGTRGVMMDMYRIPDKLLKALDQQVPIMIAMGISTMQQTGNPLIFMPLHKGADGFLSDEQFRKFYWPTLKHVIGGAIEGGCIPFIALEGR